MKLLNDLFVYLLNSLIIVIYIIFSIFYTQYTIALHRLPLHTVVKLVFTIQLSLKGILKKNNQNPFSTYLLKPLSMKHFLLFIFLSLGIFQSFAQNNQSKETKFIENLSNNSLLYNDVNVEEGTIQYSPFSYVSDIKNLSDAIVKNYCRKYKLDFIGYSTPSLNIIKSYSLINRLNESLKEHLAIFEKENKSSLFSIAKVGNN